VRSGARKEAKREAARGGDARRYGAQATRRSDGKKQPMRLMRADSMRAALSRSKRGAIQQRACAAWRDVRR